MYKRDEHFARCLEENGPWIEEAKSAKQEILKIYAKLKPLTNVPIGMQVWKIQPGKDVFNELLPKFCKWLDDNDAEITTWTVNTPYYKTVDRLTEKEALERGLPKQIINPKIQKGLTVHTDMACTIEDMESFKNGGPFPPINIFSNEERKYQESKRSFPAISINIPLDENSGMEEIEVYEFGDPPARETLLSEIVGIPRLKHGCFDVDKLVSKSLIEKCGKKVVMLNILQPHRWSKSNAITASRLMLRVIKKSDPSVDPWWLFEAEV